MNNDLRIAQSARLEEIEKIAEKAGIDSPYLEMYGKKKAKVNLGFYQRIKDRKDAKLILVTAINPTAAGEGKSTTTIGLADGLSLLQKKTIACLREPSLGPVFGVKGGATGGGYAQVVPMEEINLHFNGDMHAITTANNLIAAVLDNSIHQGNPLNINPESVVWKRCLDMNDRALRSITIAQDKRENGITRKDHFVITVATEIMAILCLSLDMKDFEERVKKCVVAYTYDLKPITVADLGVSGAVAVIMKEAIHPNLVQTLEHTPVLIHGGPFANIAHGCNSVIATKMAMKLADYVVTEAGFGADLGAEKFMDIKCRAAQIKPDTVVIVATIRALKMHGGVKKEDLSIENVEAVLKGVENLAKHIDSVKQFQVPYIVAINKFSSDYESETKALLEWCKKYHHPVELADGWARGGEGMLDLAKRVVQSCELENQFSPIYDCCETIKEKLFKIAHLIYGASDVEYSEVAEEKIKLFSEYGWDKLPICVAKTPLSLSDQKELKGRPKNFHIHVRDLDISAGAGFIVVYTGAVMTMPGLPIRPAALNMGIDETGESYGIF